MSQTTKRAARPAIVLTAEDHLLLSRAVDGAGERLADLAAELARELDRARILPRGRHSADHIRIGSGVTFRDDASGKESTITLVRPEEADVDAGRISVMTPIGVALIGMAAGKSIDWTTRSGEQRRLTVTAVRDPADLALTG
ncbi:MAG: nucleoside diphosphate kinase regulator [Bosea sp. (in: a-proteobacteria)]|uniref:nucleoside diphosphate kinase regulator n=1 Tax=Bosea sp. (in: a-proteobacteria) TaxID=1871050 RepID=UPI0027353B7F|nr:nucleoside diphosphate kinase regulator [Bosea sp. (in: a-proteobacteria)]MDP3255723.1 nucleoside diphosphate kinase regulator [Bosea sp. (in: a-proteobacteria)]MDP3319833.1 nucleoside diphosphate kinase regulator [Bosea sp. (in: a-proteobacteria)]